MAANDYQPGGNHYLNQPIQPWDYIASNKLDFFQGNIIKYITRWRDKGGIEDLKKAQHYLEKYIEIESGAVEVKNSITRSMSVEDVINSNQGE